MHSNMDGQIGFNITRKQLLSQLTTRDLYQLFNGLMDIVEAVHGRADVSIEKEEENEIEINHPASPETTTRGCN